ncbi:MAG: Flp pilus assembly complex ATPase component [Candidatus Magasanikbacteria bacterium]|uniref:Bacterial type II secretion system protein E domain-containing protein n=1 Tax=Candidatus Magasanikbacteria bacterium CG10_big_fil_rev_8_21_14_0_10_38_6 TaxID=1974647 RepID=A0A2M6P0J6_9BACT|nr:Flp pilus assembly complex ATPase component [Candidatus Magasanikbacteria bacterium]NCS72161.1 Flp pilus assembly complex ATPase component [Candidatus Magasanikbacteria bacterium]PIR77227.1 MAG: hypothetical protein COU30_03625 [Candidatus Magasanikbacteria bacterium CG10_big_fil_rev_8_21_14_0_10_38_6]
MLPSSFFLDILQSSFALKKKDLTAYEAKAKKIHKSLQQYIIDEDIVDETELYKAIGTALETPFIGLKGRDIKKDVLNIVPAPLAQTHQIAAFKVSKSDIYIAMLDPMDVQTIEFIRRKTGLNPQVYVTAPSDMQDALRRYHADLSSDIGIEELKEGEEIDEQALQKAAQEVSIINIVNSIVEHAVFEGASDIHIEPKEKLITVRYRIDGLLKPMMTLPKEVKQAIVARIKVLANLKIDEHMLPQDGRFKIKIQEEKVAFRVSILPVYDGEKIVMRLLHEGQKPLSLDELGFLPEPKRLVEDAISKPHGIILVTGPTGSGKTTTLYSVLGILNQPSVNISTIEDPIEYHVDGINQSQVNARVGFTFASGLRSFLRQDPDIIMVGEIRDKETAEIAIHAAMTGHLVLSSLHTNDAPTTIPRLLDMGIPPFLVAYTANIIVAQRLVRKICEHCVQPFKLEKRALKELERGFDTQHIKALFKKNGVSLDSKETSVESMTFYRGEGCRRCGQTGYKGRIGIYEVMEITKDVAAKINGRATAEELKKYTEETGMITMLQDGLIKAKKSITTIEEVLRVTRD